MKRPFFSIVIPTYNRAYDLQFALFCLLQQKFTNFEIVISDNCSTDKTQSIVRRIKDKRIHYSKTKKTLGNAFNIKRAKENAKGKYIFFHSDDDYLLDNNALGKIYKVLKKYKVGYIRVNYVSLSPDEKRIFAYRAKNRFNKDTYIPPNNTNKKIIDFILKSDPYFITGVIVRNNMPKNVRMIDSDPVPWFEIVFYGVKNRGGLYLEESLILAKWSRREMPKNTDHHIYVLINKKLRCESYLDKVKEKLSEKDYEIFLHYELKNLYVIMFPMIKLYKGNNMLFQMSKRIMQLDLSMKNDIFFWIFFLPSIVLGNNTLVFARDTYLRIFAKIKSVEKENEYLERLKSLKMQFRKSRLFII